MGEMLNLKKKGGNEKRFLHHFPLEHGVHRLK